MDLETRALWGEKKVKKKKCALPRSLVTVYFSKLDFFPGKTGICMWLISRPSDYEPDALTTVPPVWFHDRAKITHGILLRNRNFLPTRATDASVDTAIQTP